MTNAPAASDSAETARLLAATRCVVVGDAAGALRHRGAGHYLAEGPEAKLGRLFDTIVAAIESRDPMIVADYCGQVAEDRVRAGFDLREVQAAVNLLEEALWDHAGPTLSTNPAALAAVAAAFNAGRDSVARVYVTCARSPATATIDAALVETELRGEVAVITLNDEHTRNALGARLTSDIERALDAMAARGARAVVVRAAPGCEVWSSGHDINELPRGRRDPLGYDDPLEQCVRAIRSFHLPVIAMVHGSVWGGAFDLVLSCDVVVADETATFAITPANLGVPYNTTGLLHFLGRVPVNVIKEMFFTATPIGAEQAERWLVVNHLVPAQQLEEFTLALASTMASKAPLAIAAVKEQLRVLTDYQPVAAQVYERIQGLRRQAYDSADYVEGLKAFSERRAPHFRGR